MPQLFPMNWNLLIIYFLMTIITSAFLVYFTYKPNLLNAFKKISPFKKLWNW
uniref:ATP synthase F0 subunit 8 n=1 Tax=Alectorobius rietcorreai TaxID=1905324 RepID=UPI002238139D|nr:ATP synthase F0 subunit 8 [Alectorobius rietcorreai]UYB78564.1 ATP synthase F0 subunit 8 [Alectorobius rietcorreai]